MRKLAAAVLLWGMLSSVALAESPEDHARMVEEAQKRMRRLGRKVVVLDRFRAEKSTDYVRDLLVRDAGIGVADAGDVAPDIQRRAACRMTGECARIMDGQEGMFRLVLPNHPALQEDSLFAQVLKNFGDPLSRPLPLSVDEFNRFSLDHETFGHGTERDDVLDPDGHGEMFRRAASELRADVCAMVSRAAAGGHVRTGRMVALMRTLSCWNGIILEMFGGNALAGAESFMYNHGDELGRAADLVEKALPRLRSMDENQRLAFADNVFAQVRPAHDAWETGCHLLKLTCMMACFGDDTQATEIIKGDAEMTRDSRAILTRRKKAMDAFLLPSVPAPSR